MPPARRLPRPPIALREFEIAAVTRYAFRQQTKQISQHSIAETKWNMNSNWHGLEQIGVSIPNEGNLETEVPGGAPILHAQSDAMVDFAVQISLQRNACVLLT